MRWILLLSVLIPGSLNAQEYVFRVMAVKGTSMVRTSTVGSWKKIESGQKLVHGNWVKVADKSYLGLVHNTGKTAALETPGEFEITSIESSIKEKKRGLGAKYTDFVMNDAPPTEELMTRGAEDAIEAALPTDGEVAHEYIWIRWVSKQPYEKYTLTFFDIFEDVLATVTVQGNSYYLDLEDEGLHQQPTFILRISAQDGQVQSQDYVINRLSEEELRELLPAMDEAGEKNAMDFVLLGAFYEEQNLLIDASNFYQEAINRQPEIESFGNFYQQFLKRHHWK